MTGLAVYGWTLRAVREFADPFAALREQAERLYRALPPEEYRQHPTVKLYAALRRLVLEIVPNDPNASEFILQGDLARFRRAKKRGLPERCRLFWIFSSRARTIIYLYVNDHTTLRKEGASSDPYEVFRHLLNQGKIGSDFEANARLALEKWGS